MRNLSKARSAGQDAFSEDAPVVAERADGVQARTLLRAAMIIACCTLFAAGFTGSIRAGQPPSTRPPTNSTSNWPGFRGPGRDGVFRGVKIVTDWVKTPPVKIWRRAVGLGYSSFAVQGDLLFTQEQQGEQETVACYGLTTGKPVWSHRDAARFSEFIAGAGPRATPAVSDGRVYALGATGIVNALNVVDGAVVWTQNVSTDSGVKVPDWGFAGSPLVVDDIVIVASGGKLVAYDKVAGKQRWVGPPGFGGYSSPQLAAFDGVTQVLLAKSAGIVSVLPTTGALLWKHTWKGDGIVQPALTTDGVLLGSGSGIGTGTHVGAHRLAVAKGAGGWSVEERWTSPDLKPYYNDSVVHKGHAYGVDGALLACIDLADGKRKWKGGRYGRGQLLLLPDQDLLLVLSEDGKIALVDASPTGFKELARVPGIDGKTWNHPALVGDMLLIRNGQEMAAFRLPLAP